MKYLYDLGLVTVSCILTSTCVTGLRFDKLDFNMLQEFVKCNISHDRLIGLFSLKVKTQII